MGDIDMNIQELQTVLEHRLNLKIFVINNDGYLSMRQTQQGFFVGLLARVREAVLVSLYMMLWPQHMV